VESAEVLDARTIRFRFEYGRTRRPGGLLVGARAAAPAGGRLARGDGNAPFNRNPVGSGPFRFREWRANERVVLEANPDYPEGLGGPPAADRVVFRIIPEAATRLTELLTGGIHIQLNVEPDQVQRVEQTAAPRSIPRRAPRSSTSAGTTRGRRSTTPGSGGP
jgi:peptide/nickel transport system substrate-binding protein